MRRESAVHISAFIGLPGLRVRLTNTVNLSSVSLNATSSGVVSLHVSSDRVVVIDWTLMTVIFRSLARTSVCSEERSDLLLLWKRSLITDSITPSLSVSAATAAIGTYLAIYSTLLEYSSVGSESSTCFPWGSDRFVTCGSKYRILSFRISDSRRGRMRVIGIESGRSKSATRSRKTLANLLVLSGT